MMMWIMPVVDANRAAADSESQRSMRLGYDANGKLCADGVMMPTTIKFLITAFLTWPKGPVYYSEVL
jgi:hypothetical protein